MIEAPQGDRNEGIGFWRSWKGLYLFVVIYGVLQVALLWLFTLTLNHS